MPLWPTLCGANLWLVALAVPLFLAGRGPATLPFVWAAAPLAPLCLLVGLRRRQQALGQVALLLGVPLLAMLPGADGALADARLQPRPAVLLQVALLVAYVASVCRMLATELPPRIAESAKPLTKAPEKDSAPPRAWQLQTLKAPSLSQRLERRILIQRMLLAYTIVLPALLLYAIDLHPENLRALRAAFGTAKRVGAMEASLTAAITVLCSVVFYFCIMAPLGSYLDHHRQLRGDLQKLRRQARRGRPRANLYIFMLGALLGMILLIIWSLRP